MGRAFACVRGMEVDLWGLYLVGGEGQVEVVSGHVGGCRSTVGVVV